MPRVFLALAIVYVVWGSTYLAIRVGVADTPPYLFAAIRFLAAGALVLVYARVRRLQMPRTAGDWRSIAITGILLLAGANGLVTWSEQWIASGLAALVVATSALWMAAVGSLGPQGEPQSRIVWTGLGIGFLGVAMLVRDGIHQHSAPIGAYAALIVAPILWAMGSIYGRRHPLSCPPLVTAGFQMLLAGILMALIGLLTGEGEHWHWTSRSWGAWAYLVVFGSCIGYGAYYWLVHNVSPAMLGTYAYVNPAVAVLLGCWLGGESLTRMQLTGTAVILLGVVAVTLSPPATRNASTADKQ